ncbi:helix-turn-helix transcriptional regulator [Marinilongibacter aquaticus]|uniref:helix-turn-helix domain-containing protein n=1 Tax=Marinilongibacter aquaticus TaxID=2975157 RepID=UPI0021BDABD6|nr:response regulator transcription factor [Marinilongibacter aquaticus]UBM60165.1 helix-turn-helix transcriptional regulator [Marinilongibacter aquaticus]
MSNNAPIRLKTIAEFHEYRGLPKPEHPLVSVVDLRKIEHKPDDVDRNFVFDFYSVSIKKVKDIRYKYGQQDYDFDEGVMFFMAPNQVFGIALGAHATWMRGRLLLIHPDFLWNTPLAEKMRQYEYFDYSVNEALFLSEKEEAIVENILQQIQQEYHSSIDKFSQQIIVSQIETLLNYGERFYQRQFVTRQKNSHQILEKLENWLADYFESKEAMENGLPTVQSISEALHVTPNYLSSLLKVLTGLSTQQHIHEKLIEKAKEKLSVTDLSISEIAYYLGFEHPQSFSKLFKTKTQQSPLEFRKSFN